MMELVFSWRFLAFIDMDSDFEKWHKITGEIIYNEHNIA